MTDFSIKATKNTPLVEFQSAHGKLVVSGVSYPEDARSFYEGLTRSLSELQALSKLHLVFNLDYLSSSSVACTLQMLKDLQSLWPSCQFSIELFHDAGDDDMMSVGENYESLSGIKVSLIAR